MGREVLDDGEALVGEHVLDDGSSPFGYDVVVLDS